MRKRAPIRTLEGQQVIWPFATIAGVAVGSILLPPGPARPAFLFAALGIAGLLRGLSTLQLWTSRPPWAWAAPLIPAVAALGMLIYSAGTITGLTALLLLPMFFAALYGRRRDSLVVILAVAVTLAILGWTASDSTTVVVRLLVFWVSLMSMISIATHLLRDRLATTVASAEENARQSAVIAHATRMLTSILDPKKRTGAH